MYALAYNLLRNRDEARDCVQDVYAELWKKRDTIETDKPPLPFVLTMVRNNCLDRWQQNPQAELWAEQNRSNPHIKQKRPSGRFFVYPEKVLKLVCFYTSQYDSQGKIYTS